ncbi:MAG: hypothetical protein M3O02_03895 [Acidobacteriota bacterium]|nr:hypothetical protein [Acidobacteriota bacterium]
MSTSFDTAPVFEAHQPGNWTIARERWAEQHRLVALVVAAYVEVCSLPVLIACNYDRSSWSGANRWSPMSCHYRVDVERTVRKTIDSKPEPERPKLWGAWDKLCDDGEPHVTPDVQSLIRALAPAFYRAQLHPGLYFKPVQRGRAPESRKG